MVLTVSIANAKVAAKAAAKKDGDQVDEAVRAIRSSCAEIYADTDRHPYIHT
jgi:hypothetical protein